MNKALLNLYTSKWDKLCTSMQPIINDQTLEIQPTCPLLLSIGNEEEFKNADIRLMVYGQETGNWHNAFQQNMQPVVECYENFFNSGECWKYGGHFWNGVSRFIQLFNNKYPNKKVSLVWNNIVKIGKFKDNGLPPDYIYEVERECFSVIKSEIKIIQPTVVLFLTGPNYDSIIADNFGKIKYNKIPSSFSEREIAELNITGVPFAFRTYHPNYLWRNNINHYFQTIINKINMYSTVNINLKTTNQLKEELLEIRTEKSKLLLENNFLLAAELRDREKTILEIIEFRS